MRPTSATIRLKAIRDNYRVACSLAPGSSNIAVIKANAYGHGAVEVATVLQDEAPAFAVAFFEEAVQLRDAGIEKPVLLLQGSMEADEVAEAADRGFWLMVHKQIQLDQLCAAKSDHPVRVWLKLETGMHRLGLDVQEAERILERLLSLENVCSEVVICTQLACADDPENPVTNQQVNRIRTFAERHRMPLSIANSAAIMTAPESHAQWNRPGYMLYGNSPFAKMQSVGDGLRPAMTMRSQLIGIQELSPGESVGYGHVWTSEGRSRIGTVAIGYGDGYPRHAPNGTPVLVNGRRAPLVGRVSMDMLSVDLTAIEGAQLGGEVELWGENLSVNEVASFAGTSGYELLAGLTGRVPLVHQ